MSPTSPEKINRNGRVAIPVMQHPVYRTAVAFQDGVNRNILLSTWGGLGDQICAEPTLRYALKAFHNCDVSLASAKPELFTHLKFKEVFDLNKVRPIEENYLVYETIVPPDESNLVWCFFSHMLTHCVDFASMCALRLQLPIADKGIILEPTCEPVLPPFGAVVIHPGRHWPSKTFPKDWWDRVIRELKTKNLVPVIIGADTDDNRGTVDVDTVGCVDFRNKLSVIQTISLLKNSRVLFTNDSAPLHMAAASRAWIGFVATCKHPDLITHWRNGVWGWRMENLGLDGIWNHVNHMPNQSEKVTVDQIDEKLLRSFLPNPTDVAEWAQCAYRDWD